VQAASQRHNLKMLSFRKRASERVNMKRCVVLFAAALVAIILIVSSVIAFNTLTYTSLQIDIEPVSLPAINFDRAVVSLQRAVQFKTLSHEDSARWDAEPFRQYHSMLEEQFPLVHQQLTKEMISELSLLYTWQGTDPTMDGLILLAHQDVVAAPDVEAWEHPPVLPQ